MTVGQLFQRAKERYSELNRAIDTMDEGSPVRIEAEGRFEEVKVWMDLISDAVIAEAVQNNGEALITLTPEEYAEMRQEIRERREFDANLPTHIKARIQMIRDAEADRHDPGRC